MKFKDYYQILGVAADADVPTIKKAYRKLVRQYHPDVSKEKDAEEKIKEINEAYEVLHDEKKRAPYDQLRQGGFRTGEDFTPPPGFGGFQHDDFAQMHDISDLFASLFGDMGANPSAFRYARQPRPARGQDIQVRVPLTLEEAYSGVEKTYSLRSPLEQTLKVKLPAGITNGQKIRLTGKGYPGQAGGPPGDCYLEVDLSPHHLFRLEGNDIHYSLKITPWEAALGAQITVATLDGPIKLKIHPGSQSGQTLRIPNKGLGGGSELIHLQIHTPPAHTQAEKDFYEKMATEFKFNPRG